MVYKFKLTIEYDLEADTEEEAIYEVADLIRQDWRYYIDEGELTKSE